MIITTWMTTNTTTFPSTSVIFFAIIVIRVSLVIRDGPQDEMRGGVGVGRTAPFRFITMVIDGILARTTVIIGSSKIIVIIIIVVIIIVVVVAIIIIKFTLVFITLSIFMFTLIYDVVLSEVIYVVNAIRPK